MAEDQKTFGFDEALRLIKEGKRVGRVSWKNALCVFLVQGSQFMVNRPPLNQFYPEGTEITYRPHIDVVNADHSIGTWSPSNGDVLADDWYELNPLSA